MQSVEHTLSPRAHYRNPLWAEKEHTFLAHHPGCAVCGVEGSVVVHHIIPVPYCLALGRPDLELDERNLITLCHSRTGALCDDHHLYIGHLGDYHSFNLTVREDIQGRFKGTRKARLWFSVERINSLQETLAAYPHLAVMNDTQRGSLRRKMDELFPLVPGN